MQRRGRQNGVGDQPVVPSASRPQTRPKPKSQPELDPKYNSLFFRIFTKCACFIVSFMILTSVFTMWYHFSRNYELHYEASNTTMGDFRTTAMTVGNTTVMRRLMTSAFMLSDEQEPDLKVITSDIPLYGQLRSVLKRSRNEIAECPYSFSDKESVTYTASNHQFTAYVTVNVFKLTEKTSDSEDTIYTSVLANYKGHNNFFRAGLRFFSWILTSAIDELVSNLDKVSKYFAKNGI